MTAPQQDRDAAVLACAEALYESERQEYPGLPKWDKVQDRGDPDQRGARAVCLRRAKALVAAGWLLNAGGAGTCGANPPCDRRACDDPTHTGPHHWTDADGWHECRGPDRLMQAIRAHWSFLPVGLQRAVIAIEESSEAEHPRWASYDPIASVWRDSETGQVVPSGADWVWPFAALATGQGPDTGGEGE